MTPRAPAVPLLLALVLLATAARADDVSRLPGPLDEITFAPPLGERLPRDVALREASGPVTTADLLAGRPLVLVPAYYGCPMLCSMVLDGLVRALRPLDLALGEDLDVVVFSFDPGEEAALAARARGSFLAELGRPAAAGGVRFLVGDAPQLSRLTDALGVRAVQDPTTGEWAHAAGLVVVAPDGTLSRALTGVEFAPRDLRLAVAEAGRGEVGTLVDAVLLYCFRWDPATGRYGAAVMNLVRLGGALTVALLLAAVVGARRRPRPAEGEA